jgi:hypothetical protein
LLASLRAETLRELKRTLHIGFRKVKLKKKLKRTWDSASLRTQTLRVMHIQFLGMAVLFVSLSTEALRKLKRQCKSVGKDFERQC